MKALWFVRHFVFYAWATDPIEDARTKLAAPVRRHRKTRLEEKHEEAVSLQNRGVCPGLHGYDALTHRNIPDITNTERLDTKPKRVKQCKERVAVIIRGASFRKGHQSSAEVATNKEAQLEATDSQIANLIAPFEQRGFCVDVYSATYTTEFTQELIDRWRPYLRVDRRSSTMNPLVTAQDENMWDAATAALCHAHASGFEHSLVVVIRHDMVFKRNDVADLILNKRNKFTAPFKMVMNFRFFSHRVPDTMQTMPGKFFPIFLKVISEKWPHEDLWKHLLGQLPRGINDVGFLLPYEYADSDSEKLANQLYKFSQRPEGPRCEQTVEKAEDASGRPGGGHPEKPCLEYAD